MSKKVALLIGVSDYGEGIPSLSAPLNDVEAMKRVLENPSMGGFDQVKKLPNPDLPAMQKAVQQIFANAHKDDLVLLFFSGHGITDDNNRLYLTTKGTSKKYYKATSVPASFIQDISLESYAKRQVIVLDCCYSGAFAEGWQAKSIGLNLERELGKEGRVVLTSSTATQTSFQQEGEDLSLYTQYFVEGIETGAADKNSTGKIFVHQLHEYAKAKVQEVKPKQKPDIIIDQEGFNILLSQAPVDDPELDYRKLVERYATEGQITIAGNYILQVKRQELDITDERSDEIINEVLAPYRKRIENIKLYQQAFTDAVEQNYPLTERLMNELKDLEDVLGLEDKDIAWVQEQIQAEKEAQHQHQQEVQQQEAKEYSNKLKQYEQEFLKAVEGEYPLNKQAHNQINRVGQSLGLRDEDIKRIEQPILAAKYEEKKKEKQRQVLTSQPSVASVPTKNTTKTALSSSSQDRASVKHGLGLGGVGAVLAVATTIALSFTIYLSTNQSEQVTPSNEPTLTQPTSSPLVSTTTGVDYAPLRDLLEAGNWKEADRETIWAMLQAAKREDEGWLRVEDIEGFPCEDLRIIDQLWLESSQGKFGFSVQKDIYQSLGGTREYNREVWDNFGDQVGWTKERVWLHYEDFLEILVDQNIVMYAPRGNLPVGWRLLCIGGSMSTMAFDTDEEGNRVNVRTGIQRFGFVGIFFSRTDVCKRSFFTPSQ